MRATLAKPGVVPAVAAALVAAVVAAVQLRDGVLQILDTGSYLSGAQAIRDGHLFTSTVAPSFSNFSVIEVLERGGRLPFVDFPIGYVSVAGLLSFVLGARAALGTVVVLATAAFAAAVVLGPAAPRHAATWWFRAAFAALVVGLPVYRLVVQGVLSEPLFCAVLVAAVATLTRYRQTGRGFVAACVLAAALGLLRFLGGGLAVLPAIEHYRRNRAWRPALAAAVACVAPVVLNVLLAGAAGGGHTNHWHGIERRDLRLVGRSIAGLLDASTGDLARTLLRVGDSLPWWGYPVAVVWAAAVVLAFTQFAGLLRRRVLPDALELCLTAAGVLTLALLAGIAAFDALATPDNRIMLPAGLLTLCGLVWWVDVAGRRMAAAAAVLALWATTAVRPWDVGHLFTQPDRLAAAETFRDLDARVVVTNDADGFHFHTGIPAAYLPPERMSLTDEPVDRAALFEALPCALWANGGVVVVFPNAMFGVLGEAELDALAAKGRLAVDAGQAGVVYRPTGAGC